MHGQGIGLGRRTMSTPAERRDRWLCAIEVAAVTLLLAGQVWLVWAWLPIGATAQRVVRIGLLVLLVAILLASYARVRDSRLDFGLSRACLKSGWGPVALFTLGGLIALAGTMALLPTAERGQLNFSWLLTYSHGMLGQQLGLQYVLNNRVHRALGGLREPTRVVVTVAICTVVFTLLHAPNPGLMLAVIPASAFWCWHFRRYHNMPALMLSHLILGGAAMVLLGDGPLLRLRVGPPALRLLLGT